MAYNSEAIPMGVAVGIVSISQFLANLQVFPFLCQFTSRHLGFNTISSSHIIGRRTIELYTTENMGVAVGISSLSSIVRSLDIRAISCSPKWWVGWLPLPPPR